MENAEPGESRKNDAVAVAASEMVAHVESVDVHSLLPIVPPSFQGCALSDMRLYNGHLLAPARSEFQGDGTLDQTILVNFLRGQLHPMQALNHVCQVFGLGVVLYETVPKRAEMHHAYVATLGGKLLAIAEAANKKMGKKVVARRTLLVLFGKSEDDLLDLDPSATYRVMVDSRGRKLIVKEIPVSSAFASSLSYPLRSESHVSPDVNVDEADCAIVSIGTTGDVLDIEEKVHKMRSTMGILPAAPSSRDGSVLLSPSSATTTFVSSAQPAPTGDDRRASADVPVIDVPRRVDRPSLATLNIVVALKQFCKDKEWPIVFVVTRRHDRRGPFYCRLWICCEPIASGFSSSRTKAMETAANASAAYLKKVLPPEEMFAFPWSFGCDLAFTLKAHATLFERAKVGVASIHNGMERLVWEKLFDILAHLRDASFSVSASASPSTLAAFVVERLPAGTREVVALGIEEQIREGQFDPNRGGVTPQRKGKKSALNIARRSLHFYLLDEILKFYVSAVDDSIFQLSRNDGKLSLAPGVSFHLLVADLHSFHDQRAETPQVEGGREEGTRKDSLKVWGWTITGVQGSVLSRVMEPIYLSSVALNGSCCCSSSSSKKIGFYGCPQLSNKSRSFIHQVGFSASAPRLVLMNKESPRIPFPARLCWMLSSSSRAVLPGITSIHGRADSTSVEDDDDVDARRVRNDGEARREASADATSQRPAIVHMVEENGGEIGFRSATCFSRASLLKCFRNVLLQHDYELLLSTGHRQRCCSFRRREGGPSFVSKCSAATPSTASASVTKPTNPYEFVKRADRDYCFVKRIVNKLRDYQYLINF